MPLYDYHCAACGPFRAWRPMREAAAPAPCPACEGSSSRTISAPNLALMASHTRTAHQRNEKSAHEPQLERRTGPGHHHHHGHGHGHAHGHQTGGRPWMIGH